MNGNEVTRACSLRAASTTNQVGTSPPLRSVDGAQLDEENQLVFSSAEVSSTERSESPRREDMEVAADLVLALDDETYDPKKEVALEDDGPQLSPIHQAESEDTPNLMNMCGFLSKKADASVESILAEDEGAVDDANTSCRTEVFALRDDIEEQGEVESGNQQISTPPPPVAAAAAAAAAAARESRREVHEHGAFYVDGRNARDVIPNDDGISTAGTQLVSAELVDPEELRHAIQQELAEQQRRAAVGQVVTAFWCSRRVKIATGIGALLVILVAVILGTVLPRVIEPPVPPTPLPGLMELLSSVSTDGGAALQNETSPQNQAVKWLAGNTNLESYEDEQKIQRYTLATLYYSTNGDNWKHNRAWLSNSDECSWYSNHEFSCSNNMVTDLVLYDNNLDGTIPAEVGLLSDTLETFEVHVNRLTGPVPSFVGELTNLATLSFYDNDLTGSVPSELGLLTSMTKLHLYKNDLTRQIPSELGQLALLKELALNNNALTGTIPSEISLLARLKWLVLYGNNLTGDFTCHSSIVYCRVSCSDESRDECREISSEATATALPTQPSSTSIPILPSGSWEPLLTVNGDTDGDWFGWSVSLSENGNVLAVGADQRQTDTNAPGYVSIYTVPEGTRIQTLVGDAADDRFGASVALSANGSILAAGASSDDNNGLESGSVRVLERNEDTFVQVGNNLNGEAERDFSGGVSLSSNGQVIAIGAIYNDGGGERSGHARVYERIGNTWSQVGKDIDGEKYDEAGCAVSLSADGSVLAVGGRYHQGVNGFASGNVRVFKRLGESWDLVADIDGEQSNEWSGWAVALSDDGNTVAIGAPNADGQVRVFRWNGNEYSKLGENINGIYDGDRFGITVALSADGNIVASGNNYAGHVQVFGWTADGWEQIGKDIVSGEYLSVSLSGDGEMIAVASSTLNATGQVSVYELV